jgi:hypothetical protein
MLLDELLFLTTSRARHILADHMFDDPASFALRHQHQTDVPARAIAEQLACRNKASLKLPTLAQKPLLFETTALEQCSSEATALYKTNLIFGKKCFDCTGGLGIDSFYFSRVFDAVTYCEKDPVLAGLFIENLKVLHGENITVCNDDCSDVLQTVPDNAFDWMYVDPSRRDSTRRYIGFSDCQPDVVALLPLFFQKAKNVAIKASPAFELTEAVKLLPGLHTSIIVSVDGECKEILFLLSRKPPAAPPVIKAVLLTVSGTMRTEVLRLTSETNERMCAQTIGRYWYVPDPAVIKARCSETVSRDYCISFVNKTVDYLTADRCVIDFPGKIYAIVAVVPWQRKKMIQYLTQHAITHANIARRDFPLAPQDIAAKLGIVHGGNEYLFFTRDLDAKPIVVHARRVDIGQTAPVKGCLYA